LQVATLTSKLFRQDGITREGSNTGETNSKKAARAKYASAIKTKKYLIDFVNHKDGVQRNEDCYYSEIIESVFGKQKYLERDYAKEFLLR